MAFTAIYTVASGLYGVVLTGSLEDWTLVVDADATEKRRAQMRNAARA